MRVESKKKLKEDHDGPLSYLSAKESLPESTVSTTIEVF